jgi:hypothetical protein
MEDKVKIWAKILLPRSPELVAKVTEMESIYIIIRVNFGFKDLELR